MWRGREEFPQPIKAVNNLANEWYPRTVLVEDAGSGQSLIQQLKRDTDLTVVPVRAIGDKQERAVAVTPQIEAGKVFLPKEARWRDELEHELEWFPLGAHDDIVDSVVQYLTWATGKKKQGGRIGRPRTVPMRYQPPPMPWRSGSI